MFNKAASFIRDSVITSALASWSYVEQEFTVREFFRTHFTGVKNKNAYVEAAAALQNRIANGENPAFAAVVFDVNDLKRVNDQQGHEAGDRHIKNASRLICDVFAHSPIFRIGGDEFTAILEGRDYEDRAALMESFNRQVEENKANGKVVVSAGFAEFDPEHESTYKEVFQRADMRMYQRKRFLKGKDAEIR